MGLFSSHEIAPAEIAERHGDLLLDGESVLTAFRSVRDTAFLTDRRFVLVDVQGLTGSKVSAVSVPWRAVSRFAVTSPGTVDLDSELSIWTAGAAPLTVRISRKADAPAVQRLLAGLVLGAA